MKPANFELFRAALSAMAEQLESGYPDDATFDAVLSGIEEIKTEAMELLLKHLSKAHADLTQELDTLLDPVFASAQKAGEPLQLLAEDSTHCFLLKKSYQISHASGWIRHNPPPSGTVADYFRLQIFADHFEILKQRLTYILTSYHNQKIQSSNHLYKCLKEILPQFSLRKYAWIRNAVNHASLVCTPDGVSRLKKVKRSGKKEVKDTSWNDLKEPVEVIIQYSILLATEIDYRSFKHAKGHPEVKPAFDHLFRLYKDAFFHGQSLA